MATHIALIVLHVRAYHDHIDVNKPLSEMSGQYRYHLIVLVNDLGVGRIEGLEGGITIRDKSELFAKLTHYGVKRVEWRHKGIEKGKNLKVTK